jgi:hypothetical protein
MKMRGRTLNRAAASLLLSATALALAGCWTAPIANVQPKGEPRLIQGGITVESVQDPATVQSVNASQRTIVLAVSGGAKTSLKAGPKVDNFDAIRVGDLVEATVAEDLTVYILKNGQLPGAGGAAQTIKSNAKVLMVDPSYRLLTLQYPGGKSETFKVGLDVKLLEMEPGCDVVVRSIEAVALRLEQP